MIAIVALVVILLLRHESAASLPIPPTPSPAITSSGSAHASAAGALGTFAHRDPVVTKTAIGELAGAGTSLACTVGTAGIAAGACSKLGAPLVANGVDTAVSVIKHGFSGNWRPTKKEPSKTMQSPNAGKWSGRPPDQPATTRGNTVLRYTPGQTLLPSHS